MPIVQNFFVITGGPCSGKTTLVHALKKEGYGAIEEVARKILREEKHNGGTVASYKNSPPFLELELQKSIANFERAQRENERTFTFFDRGIPDIISYARLCNVPISSHLDEAALKYRYNKIVFIAPPWRAIYCTDPERTESYEEAVRISHIIAAVYQEYGYSLVELPRATIEDRVQCVLDYCNQHTTR
jgi:predicted ATPase